MPAYDQFAAAPLDRAAATPLFRQLYVHLKESILNGALPAGARLPPTRTLCRMLGVSRQTVLAAYDQLMAEGYLSGTVGRGTFVSGSIPSVARAAPNAERELLRPLSARGTAMAQAMSAVRFHSGRLRAFRASMPGLDLFPFDVWRRIEARYLRRAGPDLGYGDPAGLLPLRELLCAYLRTSRGVDCTPEQVVVTSGSQQALYLLAQLLLAPGDGVWIESPGYQGACAPFVAAGARICTVPVDQEGMNIAYAAAVCPDAKLVFATPSHQLPLGVTMSLPRRLELLRWAAAHKAWVIEDDYDSEYRYTGPPLASLQSLDRSGCVIYVGTLSKVLFPGLRLGYVVAPPALAAALAQARGLVDRHSAIVPQAALADFMAAGHFTRHIRRTREAYAQRRAALLGAIDAHLSDELACGPSDAGLDLCVHFRRSHDQARVVQDAAEEGIDVRPLSYYANPAAGPECTVAPGLLLGFSALTPAQIEEGALALARVLARQPRARMR
ncbi:MocR-like pyridoxine biosynthesis transcription factor PdxR [Massilia horti]|uniref:PLP-dependent aminotransferase family protein n=1 Tax=Massilia horti TaxID=2562153 RepID=A0A4Y9SWH1_9BURK|nr:PLP-dependent aminotransferase family protein [Massilia horti]TFW30815.1 PLP-dependent aminotransferase family protein [Massilia horti]